MGNVLITGLTDRSGKHFGDLLVRGGHCEAIVLVRSADKFQRMYPNQQILSCVEGDTQNEEALEQIIRNHQIETIFHISGIRQTPGILNAALQGRYREASGAGTYHRHLFEVQGSIR